MRLRRVAIDMKKRVRGRTVRTAESSLAGLADTDGTAPAGKNVAGGKPVLSPGHRYRRYIPHT